MERWCSNNCFSIQQQCLHCRFLCSVAGGTFEHKNPMLSVAAIKALVIRTLQGCQVLNDATRNVYQFRTTSWKSPTTRRESQTTTIKCTNIIKHASRVSTIAELWKMWTQNLILFPFLILIWFRCVACFNIQTDCCTSFVICWCEIISNFMWL